MVNNVAAATVAAVLLCMHTTTSATSVVTFGAPSSTGHSAGPRYDPSLLTFPSTSASTAHVVAAGVADGHNTLVESQDGGVTWKPVTEEVAALGASWLYGVECGGNASSSSCVAGTVHGIPQGYVKEASAGPWTAAGKVVYTVVDSDATAGDNGSHVAVHLDNSTRPHWGSTPHEVGLLAFESGGITQIQGGDNLTCL